MLAFSYFCCRDQNTCSFLSKPYFLIWLLFLPRELPLCRLIKDSLNVKENGWTSVLWLKLFLLLKSCFFLVISLIKYLTFFFFWKVGIWMPAFETQKVHLYKYFCILWAFRILSPETISVMWNFHRSWHILPSGFCPGHSPNLPGQVTGDSWSAGSHGFLSVAGDTVTTPQNYLSL
jgi:hypothetical protein